MTRRPTLAEAIERHYERLGELAGAAPDVVDAIAAADPRGASTADVAAAWDAFYVERIPHRPDCAVPRLARPELEREPGRDGTRVVRCPECRAWLELDSAGAIAATSSTRRRSAGGPPRGLGLGLDEIRAAIREWSNGIPTQRDVAAALSRDEKTIRNVIRAAGLTWPAVLEEALAPR